MNNNDMQEQYSYYTSTLGFMYCELTGNYMGNKKQIVQFIENYFHTIIDKNPILLKTYSIINNKPVFSQLNKNNININDYVKIKFVSQKIFLNYSEQFFNIKLNSKQPWYLLGLINKKTKQLRLYFMIDHSYVDGYHFKEIIESGFHLPSNYEIKKDTKKNDKNIIEKIFYYVIGTLILFSILISIIFKYVFKNISQKVSPKVSPKVSQKISEKN